MSSSVNGAGGEWTMYLKHCISSEMASADRGVLRAYLEALAVLLLLLVYYAEPEVYFVGLLEVGLHLHDLGESLLGVVQRSVSVVENADAVPELGLLWQRQFRTPPATPPAAADLW